MAVRLDPIKIVSEDLSQVSPPVPPTMPIVVQSTTVSAFQKLSDVKIEATAKKEMELQMELLRSQNSFDIKVDDLLSFFPLRFKV